MPGLQSDASNVRMVAAPSCMTERDVDARPTGWSARPCCGAGWTSRPSCWSGMGLHTSHQERQGLSTLSMLTKHIAA